MPIATLNKHDIWYSKAVLPILVHKKCKEIARVTGKWAYYLGGFKFQVPRVNDDAIAHRLPGAWQSPNIFVGVYSADGQWH